MSIRAILQYITNQLYSYSDAPHLDADRIVLHVIDQREPSYLVSHSLDELSDTRMEEIRRITAQRKTGMPLAYILGEADFYGRTFIVTPDVLIPRPDTESLIEKALEYIKNNFSEKKEITIADICTGSGIIAITLVLELSHLPNPLYQIIATDISEKALEVAKKNAEKHGVLEKIEFIQGDMLDAIKGRHVDLIVSNPPYVPTEELDELATTFPPPPRPQAGLPLIQGGEIRRGLLFEPRIALDGGPDGQMFVNQIKKSGIPAIIETTGGNTIQTPGF